MKTGQAKDNTLQGLSMLLALWKVTPNVSCVSRGVKCKHSTGEPCKKFLGLSSVSQRKIQNKII